MARAVDSLDIARMFPAREDSEGRIWYRSGHRDQDGWTENVDYAHPSYFTVDAPAPLPFDPQIQRGGIRFPDDTQPQEEPSVTVIDEEGVEVVNECVTEWMRYPLPPPLPRYIPETNQYNHYRLPHPDTGRGATFPRATTIAKTMADTYNLNQWSIRQSVLGAVKLKALADNDLGGPNPTDRDGIEVTPARATEMWDQMVKLLVEDEKYKANAAIEFIRDLMGGADAREFGTTVHAWLAALDHGQILLHQIPEQFQAHALQYQAVLAMRGWVAVPEYIERLVLNDTALGATPPGKVVVGTLDRIYWDVANECFILGDLKTSGSLEFSKMEFAAQMAVYGRARKMLTTDGTGWEDMPELTGGYAAVIWLPSDHPENATIVTYSLDKGAEFLAESHVVRRMRDEAKSQVTALHALPTPTKESLRLVAARQALQAITDESQLGEIYLQFEDVWIDDLTEFGNACADLLTTTTNTTTEGA